MSCSRPINEVDGAGSERRGDRVSVTTGAAEGAAAEARRREPLAEEQRQVVADEPAELARGAERSVGVGPR